MRGRLVNSDMIVETAEKLYTRNVVVANEGDYADASYYVFRNVPLDIYCFIQDKVECI